MIIIKDKLVSFPEQILDRLEEHKKQTGIPATDYIRNAVLKQMIIDRMIWIKKKTIYIEEKKTFKKQDNYADEKNKFCDGDSCEIDPTKLGGC